KVTKSELEKLADALADLQETGERRIWMLYSPHLDKNCKDGVKAAGVLGFVAAQGMDGQLHKEGLSLFLQPGLRITHTPITALDRRAKGLRPIWNPYVCRVRLVE